MELHVVIEGEKDLTGQLVRQLKEAIHGGQLAAGEKLPPTRLLAQQLGVSRKTVAEAYTRLTYDRLLVAQVGVGTFVNTGVFVRGRRPRSIALAGAALATRWRDLE